MPSVGDKTRKQTLCTAYTINQHNVIEDNFAPMYQIFKNKPSLSIPFLEIYPIKYVWNHLSMLLYFFNCKVNER